jgi:hypothetical protein
MPVMPTAIEIQSSRYFGYWNAPKVRRIEGRAPPGTPGRAGCGAGAREGSSA